MRQPWINKVFFFFFFFFKQQILNYEDDQIYVLKFCRKFVEEQKAGYSSLQSQVFKDKQAVYW